MEVILMGGPKQGEFYNLSNNIKDGSVFPVILTEDYKYAYAEYMVIPSRTRLNERIARFIKMVERE